MKSFKMLIGGKLTGGAGSAPVINPATEQPIIDCPRADAAQLDLAVAAAKAAFLGWSRTAIEQRRAVLHAIAARIEANIDELAHLLTQEQGKPLNEAVIETERLALAFRQVAEFDLANMVLHDTPGRRVVLQRRPLGVVGAIVPWNFPLALISPKLPYALLAGNTIVLKPAPSTPLTTLRLGELIKDAAPAGVINILADTGELGPAMTAHPDIQKISFTGSTATGRQVMAAAATSLKRITLELGGNDAAILLDDADIDTAAPKIFHAAFRNCGQLCAAVKRVYAPDALYDRLCEALASIAERSVVGDGLEPGTEIGPLQNRAQYMRLRDLIDEAGRDGKVMTGGVLERDGYFIRPVIVRDITDNARLVKEEQFGPVLPVVRYSEPQDAIARANTSPYGLGASIWSSDLERACLYAEQLDCGTVWINKHAEMNHDTPFAGAKQSGMGAEFAQAGLNEFTQIRVINAALT